MGIPNSREEYSKMLKYATVICEKRLINIGALTQMVVNKTQTEIITLLYTTTINTTSWQYFVQVAEEVSWIPYPDKILARVDNTERTKEFNGRGSFKRKGNFKKKIVKTCLLQGKDNH